MKNINAIVKNWLLTTILTFEAVWLLIVSWQPTGRIVTFNDAVWLLGVITLASGWLTWKNRAQFNLSLLTKIIVGLCTWQVILLLCPVISTALTPLAFVLIASGALWGQNQKWNPLAHPTFKQTLFMELVLVGALCWSLATGSFIQTCLFTIRYEFDAQNFSTWIYTAVKGFTPYRDVFYWYGLLMYYLPAYPLLQLLAALWQTFLLVTGYALLRRIFPTSILRFWAFGTLLILIDQFASFHAYMRYGTGMIVVALAAWGWSQLPERWTKRWLFAMGALCSVLFFLIQDQGLYSALVIGGLFVAYALIRCEEWLQRSFWINLLTNGLVFVSGGVLASLPFIAWLMQTGSWTGYVVNFELLGQMSNFAKTPFFGHYLLVDNMVIAVTIGLFSIDLLYRFFFYRSSLKNPTQFIKIALFGIILLFQYKNLLRPWIANQFIFVAWMGSWIYLSELKTALSRFVKATPLVTVTLMTASLMVLLLVITPQQITAGLGNLAHRLTRLHAQAFSAETLEKRQNRCEATEINELISQAPPNYQEVVRWLQAQPNFSGQVFSYPADPVFYMLFHQLPAPYFNAYDATSETAQNLNIAFMQQPQIQYVILNVQDIAIQDEVPNVLRNQRINEYLYTHFKPVVSLGKFVILEKTTQPYDALLDGDLTRQADFIHSQLELNMQRLPFLESHHLLATVQDQTPQVVASTGAELSAWFAQNPSPVREYWLELKPQEDVPQNVAITFTTPELVKTVLSMNGCSQVTPCLINLSRVPLFFWPDRKVKMIQVQTERNSTWESRVYQNLTSSNTID